MILIFNLFSVLNLLFIAFVLLVKKSINKTDKFFSIVALFPVFAVFLNLSIYFQLDFIYQQIFYYCYHFNLLWAPFFYRYVLLKIGKSLKFKESIIHYYAFILCIVVSVLSTIGVLPKSIASNFEDNLFIDYVIAVQVFVYLFLMLIYINKYKKTKLEYFSDEISVSIKWIYEIIYIYIFFGFVAFIPIIFDLSFETCMILLPISIQAYFFFIVYKAFGSSIVFEASPVKYSSDIEFAPLCEENTDNISSKINISKENNESVYEEKYNKLIDYIENNKPYLEPEINLTRLASALEENAHNLSLTINQKFKMSFYDLINSYRVREVQRLLKENKSGKHTIESLAFDAGFNTPSSFYRAFKKHAHQTPSQYLKSIQGS